MIRGVLRPVLRGPWEPEDALLNQCNLRFRGLMVHFFSRMRSLGAAKGLGAPG